MVRRSGLPWAPTSIPEMRRQFCNALEATIAYQSTAVDEPPPTSTPGKARHLQRMTAKLAESLQQMSDEVEVLRSAELYWVSRDMVDVAVQASESLPEWTPAATLPAPNGVMCWGKPADVIPYNGPAGGPNLDVAWDGMWWWTRPDGVLQLQPLSRLARNPELLEPYKVSSPLWTAGSTLVLNPLVPRTDEQAHAPEASQFVSITGAAWLLMGQPVVAATRSLNDDRPATAGPDGGPPAPPNPSRVTIVELRRPISPPRDHDAESGDRHYQRRWWVSGHWRQQVCGPNNTQRRPTWIAPYVKGPDGAPLTADRVHVWRR
ncbi:hypothetical protein MycrhDRAFT_5561 [Mycolicibacterium rhodesiae JS60]|nr:hypothetical protein MycrhDRAFT_5561 [Mycolicibacterium rhodesiae JS60]